MTLLRHLGDAALMTAGMAWQTAWSLVLGFSVSASVSADDMRRSLGGDGPKEIALASAASSSFLCFGGDHAHTFKKGAALATSLATNLVLELGLVLLVLLGRQTGRPERSRNLTPPVFFLS